MQRFDKTNAPMRKRPAGLFKHQFISTETWSGGEKREEPDVAALPTTVMPSVTPPSMNAWGLNMDSDPDANIPLRELDIGSMSTIQLMRLSGMMRAVHPPQSDIPVTGTDGSKKVSQSQPYESLFADSYYRNIPPEMFGKTLILPPPTEPKKHTLN